MERVQMSLTFSDLMAISQLIEDKDIQATEYERDLYVRIRHEIRKMVTP
jgi:hypothetical protein